MAFKQLQQQPQQQDEVELEAAAEAELSKLKRQYRIMENDRATCVEDARLQLRSQKNMIERLEYEKAELILAIRAANAKVFTSKDDEMLARLKSLASEQKTFDGAIKNEQQEIRELNGHIVKLSKELTVLRAKVQSDAKAKEMAEQHDRMVAILENRLDVTTKRFDEVVSQNVNLRGEIESLLKERAQFTLLWNKLMFRLDTGKQIINDLIEQATITFNQRDEELHKIQALRERGLRDLKNHTSEMCELQRTLDNEMKLQEFLGVKGQHRDMADLNAKKETERRERRKDKEDKIAAYIQILQMIKEFTGEQEVDKLMAHFIKQEEENFALFNYVNELNDELETLQSRMSQLTAAIEEARALTACRGQEQEKTLEKLREQLEQQITKTEAAEENVAQSADVLDKLLKGVDSLAKAVRCDNTAILDLLGDNSKITPSNVMLYLGLVEKRIVEMFHKVYWVDLGMKAKYLRVDEEKKPKMRHPALERIAPTQPCSLCVEKEEMLFVSEGLEEPLTRSEATRKLRQRLTDDYSELLHNVSGCHLPAARKIIQKRYQ